MTLRWTNRRGPVAEMVTVTSSVVVLMEVEAIVMPPTPWAGADHGDASASVYCATEVTPTAAKLPRRRQNQAPAPFPSSHTIANAPTAARSAAAQFVPQDGPGRPSPPPSNGRREPVAVMLWELGLPSGNRPAHAGGVESMRRRSDTAVPSAAQTPPPSARCGRTHKSRSLCLQLRRPPRFQWGYV